MNSAVPFLDSQADGFGRFLNREFFGVLSIHDRGVGKGMERVGVGWGEGGMTSRSHSLLLAWSYNK